MMDTLTKYFFLLHIPITLMADLAPLYPRRGPFIVPHLVNEFYLANFNDPLLSGASDPGGWFKSLLFLEGFVQLPLCFFVVLQHYRRRQHTFVTRSAVFTYSIQVATATWACIWEAMSFDHLDGFERVSLLGFYLPYLVLPVLMACVNGRELYRDHSRSVKVCQYLESRSKLYLAGDWEVRTVLVTGANSGVGLAIVQRLIDQWTIAMERGDLELRLVLSVRSKEKAEQLRKTLRPRLATFRDAMKLSFVLMDLTSLATVEGAARQLSKEGVVLDSIICNAGMAQFVKIDVKKATIQALTHPMMAISEPNYKVQRIGGTTTNGLGITFQANFYGHFYLVGRLEALKLLRATDDGKRRPSSVIWMSSLEGTSKAFDPSDLQGFKHAYAYESSKRLIDIMWTQTQSTSRIPQYLVHPGFCSTNIVAETMPTLLVPLIGHLWAAVFKLARLCGSKYHTATSYNGAYAAAEVARDPDAFPRDKKLGSACRWDGEMYVDETPFDAVNEAMAKDVCHQMVDLRGRWLEVLSQ